MAKTINGTNFFYLIDDRNPTGYSQVVEEWTAAGGVTNLSHIYDYGLSLIRQKRSSTIYYLMADGRDSTRLLTDNGGNVVNTFTYDAYGNLLASNGVPQTPHLYCGEYWDSDLGFYYLRARYATPETGRFMTRDGVNGLGSDPASLHKYLYAKSDPINKSDPTGNDALSNLINGQLVHKKIGQHFMQSGPERLSNRWISTILASVYPGMYFPSIALLPDLIDVKNKELFEIKTVYEYPIGVAQLYSYIEVFNYFDPARGWSAGEADTYYPPGKIKLGYGAWAVVNPPLFGVITYDVLDVPSLGLVTVGVAVTAELWTYVGISTINTLLGLP